MQTAATTQRLPFPPLMLAVAGASGSGKTTLAAELARTLGGLHFSLDTYYRDLSHLPVPERALQNFDDPSMIDLPLLAAHLEGLWIALLCLCSLGIVAIAARLRGALTAEQDFVKQTSVAESALERSDDLPNGSEEFGVQPAAVQEQARISRSRSRFRNRSHPRFRSRSSR